MSVGKLAQSGMKPQGVGIIFQSSVYGATIPVIYGCARTGPLMIWGNNLRPYSSSKGGVKKQNTTTYAQNVDFLVGHNPIQGLLQFWLNQDKLGLAFTFQEFPISGGGGSVSLVNEPRFYFITGVTLEVPYDVTFSDYGNPQEPGEVTGTFEIPLWNTCSAGPNPTNMSGYRWYPYTYRWVPGSGPTIFLDTLEIPPGNLKIYYAQIMPLPSQYNSNHPITAARLTFEPELGNGIEYEPSWTGQQILYPHYAGMGSTYFDMGTQSMPAIKQEVMGAHPLYSRGDCDLADMVEDIFRQGLAQAALGLDYGFSQVQHGLNCYDYPGAIQKVYSSWSQAIFPIPSAAGNFLVALAASGSTISDTAGNTWTPIGTGAWRASAVGQTQPNTVTTDGAPSILLELGGVDTIDGGVQSFTSTISVTTTNAPLTAELILVWALYGNVAPIPADPHWQNCVVGNNSTMFVVSRIVTNPGTYSFTCPSTTDSGPVQQLYAFSFQLVNPPTYPRPLGDILDQPSLDLVRTQCRAYGLIGSMVMDSQKKASDWLQELYDCMLAWPVWSGFKLKSVPKVEQSYVGNGAIYYSPTATGPIADLSDLSNDFIGDKSEPFLTFERKAQVDRPNIMQMQHPNRSSDYNNVVTMQPNAGALAQYGARKDSPRTVSCLTDATVARNVLASMVNRANSVELLTVKFKMQAKWKLLEPGDLITVTDSVLGINKFAVRLTSVDEDETYALDCEAEPFVYAASAPAALVVSPQNGPPGPCDPGDVNAPIIFQPTSRLSLSATPQIWLAISGRIPCWGGADVYISQDGIEYTQVARQVGESTMGVTTNEWPVGIDPDTENPLGIDLSESNTSVETQSAAVEDAFVTVSIVIP